MTRLAIFLAMTLSACGAAVEAPAKDVAKTSKSTKAKHMSEGQTAIAERDLREFKALLQGTYDNQEQVYFQENLELPQSMWLPRLTLTIKADGEHFKAVTLNPETGRTTEAKLTYYIKDGQIHSREIRRGEADCERIFTRQLEHFRGEGCGGAVIASQKGFVFGDPDMPFKMRRASTFKCWVSPRKEDGTYGFYSDVILHDQGGRAWIEGEDHPRVGLKMRNVVWPAGNNRPSLVLYAYQGDDENKAVSYTWTSPDEPRIGMNLRWMQASCTKGEGVYTPNINLETGAGSGK